MGVSREEGGFVCIWVTEERRRGISWIKMAWVIDLIVRCDRWTCFSSPIGTAMQHNDTIRNRQFTLTQVHPF